ncbi:hypothetical protein CMI47_08715 [Candidatus Pacearchaeota archaeon]|nr:hypothetical protein [Candidatus Pacearchaeota archaeon]
MKITKRQLRRIIREEKRKILLEQADWAKPSLYDLGFEDAQLEEEPKLDDSEYMAGYKAGQSEARAYAASRPWEHN